MKYSKQRELIEQTVKQNQIHPTADDVYALLKPDNPNLSLGTVYRNLNTLSEKGIITKLHMPNGSDRFDGEIQEHYHVLCDQCGAIFDIQLSLANDIDRQVEEKTGVSVTAHQLIIHGTCEHCRLKLQ